MLKNNIVLFNFRFVFFAPQSNGTLMINKIKKGIMYILPSNLLFKLRKIKQKEELEKWNQEGGFPVPHIIKQETINTYRKKHQASIFLETGTYLGDMIHIQKNHFKKLITIELSEQLYRKAKKRFRRYQHIEVYQGDSGEVLNKLVPQLNDNTLFWLDGHYSAGVTAKGEKETPVMNELRAIFKSDLDHVILIDDARCFTGENDYPSLEELELYVKKHWNNYNFTIGDDIIRITKNS